jgi:hypothetical protein
LRGCRLKWSKVGGALVGALASFLPHLYHTYAHNHQRRGYRHSVGATNQAGRECVGMRGAKGGVLRCCRGSAGRCSEGGFIEPQDWGSTAATVMEGINVGISVGAEASCGSTLACRMWCDSCFAEYTILNRVVVVVCVWCALSLSALWLSSVCHVLGRKRLALHSWYK